MQQVERRSYKSQRDSSYWSTGKPGIQCITRIAQYYVLLQVPFQQRSKLYVETPFYVLQVLNIFLNFILQAKKWLEVISKAKMVRFNLNIKDLPIILILLLKHRIYARECSKTQWMFLTCQWKTSLILLDVVYCKLIKCYPKLNCFVLLFLLSLLWSGCGSCHDMKTDRKNRMLESWDEIIEDEDEVTED